MEGDEGEELKPTLLNADVPGADWHSAIGFPLSVRGNAPKLLSEDKL